MNHLQKKRTELYDDAEALWTECESSSITKPSAMTTEQLINTANSMQQKLNEAQTDYEQFRSKKL